MLLISNQPGQLHGTAKARKFDNTADVRANNLKFRQIIAQFGTYTYNAGQVIANYLKPLCSNNAYIIRNTQGFAERIREQDPLNLMSNIFLTMWNHCSSMFDSMKQLNTL